MTEEDEELVSYSLGDEGQYQCKSNIAGRHTRMEDEEEGEGEEEDEKEGTRRSRERRRRRRRRGWRAANVTNLSF